MNKLNTLFFALGLLLWQSLVQAQDTTANCAGKQYTLKFKKEHELSVTVDVSEREVVAPKEELAKRKVAAPKLMYGNISSLPIEVYSDSFDLNSRRYVVFDYVVNTRGAVEDVRVHGYNDPKLRTLLSNELAITYWKPARNEAGEAIPFRSQKLVLSFIRRLYEEDYDMH